ncbi:hypothetical protein [Rhizobium sp. BK602]|uniref:hypothetical protein n=1 Tax=Rhizobium sp. BK602 TaxID=2586986 RepID=UPI001619815B|nr:hypothetical protein [Rhizobium sp. BK602]MBB3612992.1 hypothetical protein [Rhizobium sp. BK602]
MLLNTWANKPPFTLVASVEDRQNIVAFVGQNGQAFERLSDALSNASGKIENGCYFLAKPIFVTVTANGVAISGKAPKRKRAHTAGYRITFELRSRDASENGAMAMLIATAVGCMRIRDTISACDLVCKVGYDISETLNEMAGEFIEQIEISSRCLLVDWPAT